MNLLNIKNFKEDLSDIIPENIVMVYADWCSICKSSKPKYLELSKKFKNKNFYAIDATDTKNKNVKKIISHLSENLNFSGYPTFYYIKNDEIEVIDNVDELKNKLENEEENEEDEEEEEEEEEEEDNTDCLIM